MTSRRPETAFAPEQVTTYHVCDAHAPLLRRALPVVGGPFDGGTVRIDDALVLLSAASGVPVVIVAHGGPTDYRYEVDVRTCEVVFRGASARTRRER